MEAVYAKNVDLVRFLTGKFASHYGLDWDETFAEANHGFVCSYKTWDETKGSLKNWLQYGIKNRLLNWIKEDCYTSTFRIRSMEEKPFFLSDFLEELSNDGRMVARMALDTPAEVLNIAREKGNRNINLRAAIKNHMKEQGWTWKQIGKAWGEVTELLKEF